MSKHLHDMTLQELRDKLDQYTEAFASDSPFYAMNRRYYFECMESVRFELESRGEFD